MRKTLLVLAVAILTAAAGFTYPAEAHPVITVRATDFAFDIPATIKAGFVAVDLVNAGAEPHHAQFMRLNDRVTLGQFQEALQKGPEAALPLVTLVGGPGVVATRGRQRVSLDLVPGTYVIACFVESPDGTPHLAKGMLKVFTVAGPAARPGRLRAAGDIVLSDFSFAFPKNFTGRGTYRVVNRGVQPHEVGFLRLAPGKTLEDVKAFFAGQAPAGPPPIIPAGGAQGLHRGLNNYVRLNLAPGTYVAVCFIPDPASGKPHTELGMITTFQVK